MKNGKEVVPNRAKLDWLDKTPDPNEPNHLDSNQTTVTPPNPVDVKIHKEVSVDNRRTYGEHKHLPSHDAKYHWKTTFNLSKLMNYDELILTDHFADVQAPNLDIAKMVRIDQAGKDITHKFDINTTAKENVTEIVAKCKPEFVNDFDDIQNDTETELHMTIDDVHLRGVSAISEKKYIKDGVETIPNTSQIVVNPLIKEGFHQDNFFYQNKTSNEAKVDIEKPTKVDVRKQVTVDGGKNWVDAGKLPNHDGNYTWKTEFTLPKYNNFEQLILTDHFADVQFPNLNIEKMISIMQNGVDIANKFNFSTRTNGNNVDVIATVKPEHANDFDDITEDRFAKLEMIIKDVNLKHVKPETEKKYISNGQETIPNQSTISVNPHLDFDLFKQSKDSNISTVTLQPPTDGSVHKQVSIDKGKKWVDVADLPNHDGEFTWKSEFILPKFNNFEQFVLTERFADVQMPNLDMDKMFSITQNEEDITHKFNVTKVEDTAKHTVNIIATVKQEFVDDFDDIREDKYAKVYMTIKDIHLKHVKAETEKPFVHEGIETIPNQTNITINPHLDFEQFKRNKDSNISKVNIKKPTAVKIHKQVSIDGGKTWGEIKDLPNHDGNYTWKTDFQLPKFNNFEQLILTDHFADVQFPNLDISKMVSVLQNGRDITSKFSFSTKVNGDNIDVIATLNPEFADEFDDIQTDEEAHLEMIIKDVNLKKVKAKTEEKYINDRDIEVIPNQTNIKVNAHLSFDQFKQTKDSNISKVNIIRPTDPTVGNPKDKNDRGKQVSIDGGKTWSDFKDLAKHDSLYDWKSTFNPSKYFNFDGHGSLTLTDTFEHLQTIGEVKVATMTNEQLNDLVDKDLVEIQDRAGNRISDKFTFTVEPFNKLAVTIKASVKAEFADEFDDLGGVNQGDLQTIVLYIRQATVRGATGHEEIHYLDADNRVYIPNIAGIKEDSGIKHFTGKEKTNVAKVRLPMVEPAIEKYVEADGDDSGQNYAIDQNAEQNMIMDKALERAQRVLEEVQKLSNIPEDVQKAMDKLVETVAEVSSTADDITKATEKLEERVNKALEKKNDKSEPVTLAEAQEFAQDVLKQVESLPVPYSTDVEKAKKSLVDALAESTENKKEEVVAQNIQQLAEYLKKIVEKEKAKQPSEETTTSTSVEGHSTSTRHQ
ncbi:coiled-coil domain-containing protein [Ligilactobacillus animalis]|uniref:coiled-coil domain-containing protein n=1 Tax=Ligilactobacillus animalis TaxID=1605 RepID=UPI00384D7879